MAKKIEESWIKQYWRPVMGWLYMLINLFDFIIFPAMAMILPKFIAGMTYVAWVPLTLQNGGLIHLAFGAILGIAAWTRGRYEKIDFDNNNPNSEDK